MRRILGVAIVLLLALGLNPTDLFGQTGDPGGRDRGFQLGASYPNPFNPETRIPFTLGDQLFEGGKTVKVTMVIYNSLMQVVAIPTALQTDGGNAASSRHPLAPSQRRRGANARGGLRLMPCQCRARRRDASAPLQAPASRMASFMERRLN